MAAAIDYASLRDQTLGSGQEEEAVTVNTRALIDKVLARYSGEWTTLRELIQNAADASASEVKIKFETRPSSTVPTPQSTEGGAHIRHVLLHHTLERLIVSNNGQTFNENDWARLKRIAEGNPDETKIGAFGVGFYSVFADCENPFVTSGSDTMAFYWKGNSLFTRKGKLPQEHKIEETCFVLDYRNATTPIPNLLSICQFLSTSLTFVELQNIELWLDDWKVFSLQKKSLPALEVTLPRDVETKSREGMMKIAKVESHNAQIDAFWMNFVGWTPVSDTPAFTSTDQDRPQSLRTFFSRLTGSSQSSATARKQAKEEEATQKAISADLQGISKVTVFIRINTVHIKNNVSTTFASELERATKKPPPKQTRIAILTSSSDETAASMLTVDGVAARKVAAVVTSIIPSKNGRIFIGFPTAQTTGLLAHISAPSLIPTVERENIDLNARYVRTWNSEMLDIAGRACRIAYIGEMVSLRQRLAGADPKMDQEERYASILPAAIHTLKQFTFHESTPLPKVGQVIEESFWTCGKNAIIDIPSSRGILSSKEVRIASESLSFVNRIPVVPEQVFKEAQEFITRIQDYGFLTEITPTDIKSELDKQSLTEEQLSEFLKWAVQKLRVQTFDTAVIKALFSVTTVSIRQQEDSATTDTIIALRSIKCFLNTSRIPPELPVPAHTIPHRFTKGISNSELQQFDWDELQIVPWIRWTLEMAETKRAPPQRDLTSSSEFAAQILPVLSRNWDALSQSSKGTLVELLTVRTVIPTKAGMKLPGDAYFQSVKLFDDLPVVQGLNNVKEKFLKALGVRKTIELKVIFDRLMAGTPEKTATKSSWSHIDLIKYLVSVWTDIPESDIVQLRNTALCPAEKDGDPKQATIQRFKVSELYEPRDALRALGLPILQWPQSTTQWNSYSSEGKFLKLLGIRPYPTVPEIVDIMVKARRNADLELYEKALKYFIENHYNNNYASFKFADIRVPFLPLENEEKNKLATSDGCYASIDSGVLKFPILRQDLKSHAGKFGVQEEPPMPICADRLIARPPQTTAEARRLFGYFAKRLADIKPSVAERLSTASIVPIFPRKSASNTTNSEQKTRYITPNSCFLGDGQEYGDIFDYVDFGSEANVFLLKVGCKHEPNILELTLILIREPGRILKSLGVENYRNLLRKIHVNMVTVKREKTLWKEMKASPFLLAYKDQKSTLNTGSGDDPEEDDTGASLEWHLRSASKVVIVDDLIAYNLFKEHVLAAPQEEVLEDLYWALGTPVISSLVEEDPRIGPLLRDQTSAAQLKELIVERTHLFLHEQVADSIRHDAKWLDKNLEVQMVQSVSLRRTLQGKHALSHTEGRSAYLTVSSKSKAVLSVTTRYEMWEVSQALIALLLQRPKTQNSMVLETLLTTSLIKLRSRGYNVDRILRRKAAEGARIAEAEKQKQELEERKRQEDKVRASAASGAGSSSSPSQDDSVHDIWKDSGANPMPQYRVPGAFGPDMSSPPTPTQSNSVTQAQSLQARQPRGLFSSITRQLGFETLSDHIDSLSNQTQSSLQGQHTEEHSQNGIDHSGEGLPSAPPPYTSHDPQSGIRTAGVDTSTVTSPTRIDNDLCSAINASRRHGSSDLISQTRTNSIREVASYCDSASAQNLTAIGIIPGSGMRVFLSQSSPQMSSPDGFLSKNSASLEFFASVLQGCASIFPIAKESLHIFADEAGHTIAFNRGGSLFFNFRFYKELHEQNIRKTEGYADAVVYWWVTMCHELAHNLVEEHSSRHSFYTESFVTKYFPALSVKLVRAQASFSPGPST